MAIDQEIAQRVDAYRSNPQALQQRYAANQELLDLLALQRLKSEKDDAMRKIQMEMEQNPQTIKQQKERQLLEMTKQDLTNQTAGIMQNAQKKQQKNIQRVAKQGSANPQQLQKMQAGLGALAQRQQQQGQAPMRMAAGGIVAFENGGGVTQADIDAYRENMKKKNIRSALTITDERIRDILSKDTNYSPSVGNQNPRGRWPDRERVVAITPPPPVPLGPIEPPVDEEAWQLADRELRSGSIELPVDEEAWQLADRELRSGSGLREEKDAEDPQGLAALSRIKELTASNIDMTDINANPAGTNILQGAGIGAQDPDAARKSARDDAATFLGRDEKRGKMNAYLDELKAMDVSQQDPKKLRDQEISAFLRGTAGGGSFGQTMAAGSQGMADERSAQEKASRDRLLSRLDIEKSAMDMDMNTAKSALSSGDNAYAQAMQNQRTIASILSQTRGQEVQIAIKNAQLEFDANNGNVQNILKGLQIEYTDALRRAMAEGDIRLNAMQILGKFQVDRAEHFEEALANDPTYRNAKIAATKGTPGSAKAVKDAYDALQLHVTEHWRRSGLLNTEDLLLRIIKGSGEAMPTQPTIPAFKLTDAGKAAFERNSQ